MPALLIAQERLVETLGEPQPSENETVSQLEVAPSTVRSHLHSAYKKLGVPDRAQAVMLATERGWL